MRHRLAGGGDPALAVLATAVGWWDCNDASNTDDGTGFSQLTDLSGNGNHFTQGTAGFRPVKTDTGGIISAEFDATDDYMIVSSPTSALGDNFATGGTFLAVVRNDSQGEGGVARVWQKDGTNEWMLTWNIIRYVFQMDHATTDGQCEITDQIATGSKRFVGIRYDKTVGTSGAAFNLDDNAKFTPGAGLTVNAASAGAGTDTSAAALVLGNTLAQDRTMDGGFYCGAFFDAELTDQQVLDVLTYWNDTKDLGFSL